MGILENMGETRAEDREPDDRQRSSDLLVDATGTMHPLWRDASQALRARIGEWSLLRSPLEVVFAMRSGPASRSLRLAGEVRTSGALCDIVATVAQAGWGGELVVLEDETSRSIFFESGQVVGATTTASAERLGEILWRFGAITREQLDEVVRTAERSGKRVGETAIDLEFVGPDELFRMMARQVEEVFYAAVHVASATFYLFDRFDESRLGRRHRLNTGQLLMEGGAAHGRASLLPREGPQRRVGARRRQRRRRSEASVRARRSALRRATADAASPRSAGASDSSSSR